MFNVHVKMTTQMVVAGGMTEWWKMESPVKKDEQI